MSNIFFDKWLSANIRYSSTKAGKWLSLIAYILGWIIAIQLTFGTWIFGFFFFQFIQSIYFLFPLVVTVVLVTSVYILRCHYLAAKKLNLPNPADQEMGIVYLRKAMVATSILASTIIVVAILLLFLAKLMGPSI